MPSPSEVPARAMSARAALLLTAVLALAGSPAGAGAAALRGGDIVVLALQNISTPGILLHVDVASGQVDSLRPDPPLASPQDVAVRQDGTILVADAVLGLVGVEPGTGAASVLAGPAAFGGSAPTTLGFDAGGDLLLAGPGGVHRLPEGAGSPQPVSPRGILINPSGIAGDGAGNIWVSDAGNTFPTGGDLVHVNAANGAQSVLAGLIIPHHVRYGSDGMLYVVCASGSGPTNYFAGGVYRGSPSTGGFTRWYQRPFIAGLALGPGGTWWVLYGRDISRDPFDGILQDGGGNTIEAGARGPIALVPDGVTPVRSTTWGSLKGRYR